MNAFLPYLGTWQLLIHRRRLSKEEGEGAATEDVLITAHIHVFQTSYVDF
jgi:hypothetical protein